MYSGKSTANQTITDITRFSKRQKQRGLVVRPRGYVDPHEPIPLGLLPCALCLPLLKIRQSDLEIVNVAHEEVVTPQPAVLPGQLWLQSVAYRFLHLGRRLRS